jgi:polyisoprenoid-binding protein YceI
MMNYRTPRICCPAAGIVFFLSAFAIANIGVSQVVGGCPEPPIEDQYELDNTHTSVIFAVGHFGLSYTYGRFNECFGSFAVTDGEVSQSGFTFVLKADSVDTNNDERDKHLRGPDFFDTQQFPEIKFVTTRLNKVGEVYQATGDFTMLGQTREITMPIQLVGMGKGPFGKQRAGFFTKFTIKRSEFGMDRMLGQVGDNISVTFSFEGVKKE